MQTTVPDIHQTQLLAADIESGISFPAACMKNGITYLQFCEWRRQGRNPNTHPEVRRFAAAIDEATAIAEANLMEEARSGSRNAMRLLTIRWAHQKAPTTMFDYDTEPAQDKGHDLVEAIRQAKNPQETEEAPECQDSEPN